MVFAVTALFVATNALCVDLAELADQTRDSNLRSLNESINSIQQNNRIEVSQEPAPFLNGTWRISVFDSDSNKLVLRLNYYRGDFVNIATAFPDAATAILGSFYHRLFRANETTSRLVLLSILSHGDLLDLGLGFGYPYPFFVLKSEGRSQIQKIPGEQSEIAETLSAYDGGVFRRYRSLVSTAYNFDEPVDVRNHAEREFRSLLPSLQTYSIDLSNRRHSGVNDVLDVVPQSSIFIPASNERAFTPHGASSASPSTLARFGNDLEFVSSIESIFLRNPDALGFIRDLHARVSLSSETRLPMRIRLGSPRNFESAVLLTTITPSHNCAEALAVIARAIEEKTHAAN